MYVMSDTERPDQDHTDVEVELERERLWLRREIADSERELAEQGPVSSAQLERDMDELMEHFRKEVAAGRMKP
jgi:hypothetical protein